MLLCSKTTSVSSDCLYLQRCIPPLTELLCFSSCLSAALLLNTQSALVRQSDSALLCHSFSFQLASIEAYILQMWARRFRSSVLCGREELPLGRTLGFLTFKIFYVHENLYDTLKGRKKTDEDIISLS